MTSYTRFMLALLVAAMGTFMVILPGIAMLAHTASAISAR